MTKFPFESLAGLKRTPTTQGAAVMTFQPAAAKYIIEKHNGKKQRTIRKSHLRSIESSLKSSRFFLNGETVIFDDENNLGNGQHRLTGCVNTGIPLTTWVVWGVPAEYFRTMDQGAGRKGRDHIGAMGGKNSYVAQSVIAATIRGQLSHLGFAGAWSEVVTPSTIAEFYEEAREAVDQAVLACMSIGRSGNQPGGTKITSGAAGSVLLPLAIQDAGGFDLAKDFLAGVATGEGLIKGTPGFALRRTLAGDTHKKKSDSYAGGKFCVKAWNAHANNEPMEILRMGENDAVIPYPTVPLDSEVIRDLFHARYVPAEEPK